MDALALILTVAALVTFLFAPAAASYAALTKSRSGSSCSPRR